MSQLSKCKAIQRRGRRSHAVLVPVRSFTHYITPNIVIFYNSLILYNALYRKVIRYNLHIGEQKVQLYTVCCELVLPAVEALVYDESKVHLLCRTLNFGNAFIKPIFNECVSKVWSNVHHFNLDNFFVCLICSLNSVFSCFSSKSSASAILLILGCYVTPCL